MRVADVQARLGEIARTMRKLAELHNDLNSQLLLLQTELDRRKPIKRAPPKSRPMTPELERQAREMYLNSDMTQHEVATALGINPGRVSEATRGKRS